MRSISGRCGGQYRSGFTTGQIGDILFDAKKRCDHKFKKEDKRRKACKECVKMNGFCKLRRSITPTTGSPATPGSCFRS